MQCARAGSDEAWHRVGFHAMLATMSPAKRQKRSRRASESSDDAAARQYEARADELLKAIEISGSVIAASSALSAAQKKQMRAGLDQIRTLVSNPAPDFRNVRSLAFLEQAV